MGLGLGRADMLVRIAVLGILLASGVLGALVQYSAATQSLAIAKDLSGIKNASATSRHVVAFAVWMNVVRFVTPVIFIVIFVLLAAALLGGPIGGPGRH
jgi:hypothetical protein